MGIEASNKADGNLHKNRHKQKISTNFKIFLLMVFWKKK